MRAYLAVLTALCFPLLSGAGISPAAANAAVDATIADRSVERLIVEAPPTNASPAVLKAYEDAWVGYLEYRRSGYEHRSRCYEWQFISSIVIFFMVMIIAFTGVYFSYLQFTNGGRKWLKKRGKSTEQPAPVDPTPTTFKAGATGVEVTSNVIGVVILVISIAFLYLYLVHVYPITDSL